MKNALLLTIALAVSLLAGESMLRLAGYAPNDFRPGGSGWSEPDPELGWRNRPGVHASSEAGNVPMTFWPNRQRASRADPAAAAGPRIDVLGDSITQGYGVADDETYAWRLGQLLPGTRVENLGVGGYGTYQSLRVEEARLADPPRLFVYGMFGDHLFRNVAHLAWVRALRDADGRNVVPPHVTVDGPRLVRHPGRVEPSWPLEARSAIVTELHRAWLRFDLRGRREIARQALDLLLAEMDARAKAAGSKFVVLLLAGAPDGIAATLAARGIAVADCGEPEFERDPALRIGGVGHPTAARHAAWAACLAPHVAAALAQ